MVAKGRECVASPQLQIHFGHAPCKGAFWADCMSCTKHSYHTQLVFFAVNSVQHLVKEVQEQQSSLVNMDLHTQALAKWVLWTARWYIAEHKLFYLQMQAWRCLPVSGWPTRLASCLLCHCNWHLNSLAAAPPTSSVCDHCFVRLAGWTSCHADLKLFAIHKS